MVHLSKLLKLGGFSEQIKLAQVAAVEHFGFARKTMPPDTPHSEDKTRWSVNALGIKVVDTGTPVAVTRALYTAAAEKTYAIPEDATKRDRTALVSERCDHVRTICALAEKGDEPSGDYLLTVLEKDPSPEVRKTVLSKLIFAARGVPTPYHRKLMAGTMEAVADPIAEIRGLAIVLHEHSIRNWDNSEVQVQILPQKRKDVVLRRGKCTAPGSVQATGAHSRGKPAVGGGAWQQVRDLAMAVKNRDLIIGVVNMMMHPVLPVRIAAWETFGAKEATSTKGRCRELEALAYANSLKYEEEEMTVKQLQIDCDGCVETLMEANREQITKLIEMERSRGRELSAADAEKIVTDFRDDLSAKDPEYQRIKKWLETARKKMHASGGDLEKDLARYKSIQGDLHGEIMSMIGKLLEEKSPILESVNKLCGSNGKGNWYVRRCLIHILEPMGVAGGKDAIRLIKRAREDRSPYVRRTVQRSLRMIWLAERERTATAKIFEQDLQNSRLTSVSKAQSEGKDDIDNVMDSLAGLDTMEVVEEEEVEQHYEPTPEEKRAAVKVLKHKQEIAEEDARIRALNVASFTWQEVVEILECLRPKFADRTDTYKQQSSIKKVTGEQLLEMSHHEDNLARCFKMKLRKHRIVLKLHVQNLMKSWHDAVDEEKAVERAQHALNSAAIDNASRLNNLTREKIANTGGVAIKSAYRFDSYAYGGATGLGSMLHRNDKGEVIFRKVIPCGGLVNDGDTLLNIANTDISSMTLVDIKRLFETAGDMAPCLVLLSSEKGQMKRGDDTNTLKVDEQAKGTIAKKARNVRETDSQFMRTVHITCQPPPFREEYLESIGLDVEVYQGDATRSLQVMTFLQRNGFASLLSTCLVDLHIKKLVELAERYNDDAWIESVGIKSTAKRAKFKKLLERLAFRYGMRDYVPEIKSGETRPDAHHGWVFITGFHNTAPHQHASSHRTFDSTQDINEFRRFGRTPVMLQTTSPGMEYTVCWHPQFKIAVELAHASAGTLRFAKPSENGDFTRASSMEQRHGLPGVPGAFDFFVVFSDGSIEPASKLNAEALLLQLVSQTESVAQPIPTTLGDSRSSSPLNSRPGTSVPFGQPSRPSTSDSTLQLLLPDITGALHLETMHEHEEAEKPANRQGTPQKDGLSTGSLGGQTILTSGSHLGSAKCNKGFSFQIGSRPPSATSQVSHGSCDADADVQQPHVYTSPLKPPTLNPPDMIPAKRDRAWYVKGTGRGPSRGYSRQRKFVREGGRYVEADTCSSLPAMSSKRATENIADSYPRAADASYCAENSTKQLMASGGNMGFFGFGGTKGSPKSDGDSSEEESEIGSDDEEEVVGFHVEPVVGHRVLLRATCMKKFPELVKETGKSTGTLTWVDPTDADGDGVTGDISEVTWDNGYVGDYRTGYEGTYRLCLDPDEEDVNRRLNIGAGNDEVVVGLDIEPLEGQRVVFMAQAMKDNPDLWEDSRGGPGTILWVDPEDADGDGVTGDICEVEWDLTNERADYRTGYEGSFRLAIFDHAKVKKQQKIAVKKQERKSLGRNSLKTIDRHRQQPPDDPWKFWEESTAETERLEHGEMSRSTAFRPEAHVPYQMMAEGPHSSTRAGSWKFDTRPQNNGSTIQICFDPVAQILGEHMRLANDAQRLGLKFTHGNRQRYIHTQATHKSSICPVRLLAIHLTGDGLVVISPDAVLPPSNLIAKNGAKPPVPGRAVVVSRMGCVEELGVEEAELVVEGIPRTSIQEVLSLKRNEMLETPAGAILEGSEGFSGSEYGCVSRASSSRPGSRGYLRMSKDAEVPLPLSIRSVKRNAKHQRPITPITGKPYTALRPSSRGSVRHVLNLEDSSGVGQDMLSRNAVVLTELKSKEGDYGRLLRLSTEANVIIDDDAAR